MIDKITYSDFLRMSDWYCYKCYDRDNKEIVFVYSENVPESLACEELEINRTEKTIKFLNRSSHGGMIATEKESKKHFKMMQKENQGNPLVIFLLLALTALLSVL